MTNDATAVKSVANASAPTIADPVAELRHQGDLNRTRETREHGETDRKTAPRHGVHLNRSGSAIRSSARGQAAALSACQRWKWIPWLSVQAENQP